MNQDKAREFFSAYYEATLEPGLRQAFELRLSNDPTLQADYAAFVETMEELDMLPQEEIEIPMFLSERIQTRIEQDRASRRDRVPVWTLWLRGLAFSGLATAAIAGAFLSITSRDNTAKADLIGSAGNGDRPAFSTKGSSLVFDYRPQASHTVVVSSGITGRELKRFVVDGSAPSQPFDNPQAGTALFQIQVLGEPSLTLVAVPGTARTAGATGEGTLKEFAIALADRYRTNVVVRVSNSSEHLSWKFGSTDALHEAETALKGSPYVVDQRDSGILNVMDR